MGSEENARAFELSAKSGLRQPSQGYKYLSITKTGHRSKFKWLGDFEELKLFVDGYLKITGTWSYTTNNGGFHTMKAEGAAISFYPGTKTLNVQGSKSEVIGQKLLQLASTGSEEQSHFAASNIQTNFVSDDDHEQQEGVEEHETDFGGHYRGLECSYQIPEVGKLHSEFAELSNFSTARRSDETRLHDENRDLKQKLQELEMQYDSLKRESRAIQFENKSLLTALRLLSSEIANETKHTAPELNVQADGEWTQA
ncbi:unnamed protein product [Porites evermanni]|uniref:Uncharacterized protein n=1 Tax=Porites evermanni TaxID=104178 RepID=A0ABN8PVQ8_9CNID|nr:unnamed protein product [Porites evermanni]